MSEKVKKTRNSKRQEYLDSLEFFQAFSDIFGHFRQHFPDVSFLCPNTEIYLDKLNSLNEIICHDLIHDRFKTCRINYFLVLPQIIITTRNCRDVKYFNIYLFYFMKI